MFAIERVTKRNHMRLPVRIRRSQPRHGMRPNEMTNRLGKFQLHHPLYSLSGKNRLFSSLLQVIGDAVATKRRLGFLIDSFGLPRIARGKMKHDELPYLRRAAKKSGLSRR